MVRVSLSLHAFLAIILAGSLTSAAADTYTWTDEQSIVHYTDDPELVPKLYRAKIRKLDDYVPSQPAPASKDQDIEQRTAPLADEGPVVQETYAGKSYDQWAKEFTDREAAMTAVRKRIDENADQLRSSGPYWEDQKNLFAERKALLEQFKEMKAEFFQQVEIARKAGLRINIEQ